MLKNFLADELAFPIAIGGEDHLIAALEGIGDRPRSFRAMSCFITDQVGRPLDNLAETQGHPGCQRREGVLMLEARRRMPYPLTHETLGILDRRRRDVY